MEVPYLLHFRPHEDIDYSYNLVCVTERERFIVPIKALGQRGLLDFPDRLTFEECPVRHETSKTVFVRNIGSKDTKFELKCDEPFGVHPTSAFLRAQDSMQFEVVFKPKVCSAQRISFYNSGIDCWEF
jgi:hypothetical protein